MGPKTLECPLLVNYVNNFHSQHQHVFHSSQSTEIQTLLSEQRSDGVIKLIYYYIQQKELYLFIDMGQFFYQKDYETAFLLKVASISHPSNLTVILALSSGALTADLKDSTGLLKNMYVSSWAIEVITGFTEKETRKYVEMTDNDKGLGFN